MFLMKYLITDIAKDLSLSAKVCVTTKPLAKMEGNVFRLSSPKGKKKKAMIFRPTVLYVQ